jgi:hypothetical protein
MNNLIQKVENLKEQLQRSNATLLQVVAKIKVEISDSYYKYISNPEIRMLHHALMLCLGVYGDKYSDKVGKYKIERAKVWKTNEHLPYCNLYSETWKNNSELVGVIAYKKDFFQALKKHWDLNPSDIWKYVVKHKNYVESLGSFCEVYEKDFDKFYELFQEFIAHKNSKLGRNYHQIHIINYKPLKIKDVVVYTNDNIY